MCKLRIARKVNAALVSLVKLNPTPTLNISREEWSPQNFSILDIDAEAYILVWSREAKLIITAGLMPWRVVLSNDNPS